MTIWRFSAARRTLCLTAALLGTQVALSQAQQLPSLEAAAQRLQETVVTLRVQHVKVEGEDVAAEESSVKNLTSRVTVCSGVLLGSGRVVTSVAMGRDCSVRITLPGGNQSTARVRVVDEYSGLSVLEIDDRELEGIQYAEQLPQVGAWVMSGAGWGGENPVISFGIVSGTEIAVPRTTFPPLLRCDLRIAQTSSGAAVTNCQGELIGVVVLADRSREHGGWTYAVPVAHVLRLTRTLDESNSRSSVLVLKRRRPVVGMVLDGDGQRVSVSRVRADSPASRAGIEVGDEVLATDQVKIRSVYQALRPVLRKQPGDRVTFLVQRNGRQLSIPVVLGGGVEMPSAPPDNFSQLVQPRIDLEELPRGGVRASSTVGEVREFGRTRPGEEDAKASVQATDAEKIKLLEKALDRYRNVIAHLNQQLEQSESERAQSEARIKVLEKELEMLRKADGK